MKSAGENARFYRDILGIFFALYLLNLSALQDVGVASAENEMGISCPVTLPLPFAPDTLAGTVSNQWISTSVNPEGYIFSPITPGFRSSRDGYWGQKQAWASTIPGELAISGRRLDAEAPPLRAYVSSIESKDNSFVSIIMFPTPGCWEVVGSVQDKTLRFFAFVVVLDGGPTRTRDL